MIESGAKEIVKLLKKKKATLATAESITGGGLGSAITDISGASDVFLGGVIAYSDEAKINELQIPKAFIKKHTAVSEEVAIAMAVSVREKFGGKYAIATTGVAGPGKAYGQKAGTVWIAIASVNNNYAISLSLAGDRTQVRKATIDSAFAMFSRILRA
jgi:nicotinamide-nucleotide amidase